MTTAVEQRELIPGYVAIERLGAGGYGEVWKVEAPGGLEKAIKLVYGFLGDERAERELKSLLRIKEVRHPFLLSLERIEVIEGRLLIVTELADGSIMDRFEQCRAAGMPGIPREELLSHLHDTADALDYMQQHHKLQHLDVKPENLLLVGGRAKVADFGLVKELADKTRSMVGAMTPTYAAPELFDGRASHQCDQYSLAIVYQEMLTGVLPFPGRTAAQLAAQHTQSRPQLAALPAADRNIVARALSKRAEERFTSCRELIRSLQGVQSDAVRVAAAAPVRRASTPAPAKAKNEAALATHTVNLDEAPATGDDAPPADATQQIEQVRLSSRSISLSRVPTQQRPVVKVGTKIVDLPPAESAVLAAAERRPTLFIGAGGTGVEVLGRLNRRLTKMFPDAAARPPVSMLAFDVQRDVAKRAMLSGMLPDDVTLLKLRDSHEYRAESDKLLKWISRRWLFSIPKSAETCGIRPLGRLALVDHAGVVVAKLKRRLATLLGRDENAPAVSDEERRSPRIVIVGSPSGGSGGGMLLELAYAVRNLLSQMSTDKVEVAAFFAHATNRCANEKQLAQANAYGFLSELQHYAQHGSFGSGAGDSRNAMFEGEGLPLDDIYFCHLGDDLDTDQFNERVERVATYLAADVATPIGGLIARTRSGERSPPEPSGDVKLRSLAGDWFDGVDPETASTLAGHLSAMVTRLWLTEEKRIRLPSEPSAEGETIATFETLVAQHFAPLENARVAPQVIAYAQQFPPTVLTTERNSPAAMSLVQGLISLRDQLRDLRSAAPPATRLDDLAASLKVDKGELQAKFTTAAANLERTVFERYLPQAFARPGQVAGPSLAKSLETATRREATAMVQALKPDTVVGVDGQLRPAMSAVVKHFADRQPAALGWSAFRRTFVLRPQGFDLDAPLASGLGRACTIVDCDATQVVVCDELHNLSLAQVAHSIVGGSAEIRDVAMRIHTRADIEWTEPPRVVVES